MRKRYLPGALLAAMLFVAALPPVLSFSGCKSPAQGAYTTAQTVSISVEAGMGLWSKFVEQNHPGPAVESKVKMAYDAYRAADISLLEAGRAMVVSQTPGTDALTKWQAAESALTVSINNLFGLLKELGVKLP